MIFKIKRSFFKKMITLLIVLAVVTLGVFMFVNTQRFGRTPQGERLERIKGSPNYLNGKFRNIHETPQLTSDKSFVGALVEFLFKKKERFRPDREIPSVKTDLKSIDESEDLVVWFGHSSYIFQLDRKKILVDPVLSNVASPVGFFNGSFNGTDIYKPEDMPNVDYLIITHDHWDHLDYPTIKTLKPKIGKVICGLGVGEHFERWGFNPDIIVEMDWNEQIVLDAGVELFCLPARHFSGRGFSRDKSLWVSFMYVTDTYKLYIGGDSGYGEHFASIGERFGTIDMAILENGQYSKDWKYIHLSPDETLKAAKDLNAKYLFPVHNSRYALGNHPWDEPMEQILTLYIDYKFRLLTPMIGEKVYLYQPQTFKPWWKDL